VTDENEALSAQGKRNLSEVNGELQPSETLPAKAVNSTELTLSADASTPEFQASSLISFLFLFSGFFFTFSSSSSEQTGHPSTTS